MPGISFSPPGLSFTQAAGTSGSQSLVVTNNGTAPLNISAISLTGANASNFALAGSSACTSLGPGTSCTLTVTFTAPAAGNSVKASVSFTDNAAGSPQGVPLTGQPAGQPTGLITYLGTGTPASVTGASVTLPLRVYVPAGPGALYYLETVLATPGGGYILTLFQSAGAYWAVLYDSFGNYAPQGDWVLTPNGSVAAGNVSLSGLQISNTQLSINGNEVQFNVSLTQSAPTFSYQVSMGAWAQSGYSLPWFGQTAVQWSNGPAVTLSPTSLTFSTAQKVGTASASQAVSITNTGNAALAISSIATSGGNADDFSVRADSCPSSLAPGAGCTATVVFTPSAAGSRTTSLVVQDNAPGSAQSVPVMGTGSGSGPAPPAVLTTYVGVWGDPVASYASTTVMLPLRLYSPVALWSGLGYLQADLTVPGATGPTYLIYLLQHSGVYTLEMQDTLGHSEPYPSLVLTPNGPTTATAIALPEGIEITAARLGFVGNELQLDLTITQSGAFNYQVQLGANATTGYSVPWFATAATWGN